MPKIPNYVSEVGVPLVDQPRISGALLAAPYEALRTGAQGIETGASVALGHVQAIEDEKKRQAQANDTLGLFLGATNDIEQAQTDLRFGKRDPESGELIDAPATSRDYVTRFQTRLKEITNDTLRKTTDPGVAQSLQRMLARSAIERTIHARHFATSLFVDEQKAEADEYERESLRLASSASDPTDAQRYANIFRTYLDTKGGVFGNVDIGQRRERFERDLAMSEGNREIDVTGTYERENYQNRLDPARLDALDRRAESV